ncbi:hypothetical protein BDZ91DRAFT_711515 [Kalaharituber pfeilii]|nr:hypothetical protein BDZ91DRAFT_711515 [Kalaharituber pfeilii]
MKRSRNTYEGKNQNAEFVFYGTPLPPLDANIRDDGSFVPIWKQEVTDERGRKRLHGAFTGGFSAGYFNTVGSKEGWTPSTFKSSREDRAKAVQARPEDFMDEEDFAAAAEDRVLETNRNFTGLGGTADELAARAKFTVMDLFKPPPEETMGVKLLRKMGWKEGQGIGPKVKRAAIVIDNEADQGSTENQQLHYFAPANSELITLDKKDDYKGLGYTGIAKQEDSIRDRQLEPKAAKTSTKRGGFGVGVLNEEDEDDEDIYEIKPKSSYNRVIGGDKKKATKPTPKVATPGKHVFTSKKASALKCASTSRKCFDGRLPLPGFLLSTEPIQTKDGYYPPPEVPANWVPKVSQKSGPADSNSPQGENAADGELLGETPLPGKSVFDFMSPAARARIAAATGRTDLPPARNEPPPPGYTASSPAEYVPKLDKAAAFGALSGGFMPYADDLEKRLRYRRFLEIQAGLAEGLPDRKPGISNGDWVNELNEFANCARIFKPASGMISSRFTSSTSSASQLKTSPGVISTDPDVLIHRPTPKEKSPAEQAASMGMYGGLTRTVEEFWPTRLLCKRFNVRPPKHVEAASKTETGGSSVINAPAKFDSAAFMEQSRTGYDDILPRSQPPQKGPKELVSRSEITEMMREVRGDATYELPTESEATVDVETNEALEGGRAADEVFKAIFGDDEDDDESD